MPHIFSTDLKVNEMAEVQSKQSNASAKRDFMFGSCIQLFNLNAIFIKVTKMEKSCAYPFHSDDCGIQTAPSPPSPAYAATFIHGVASPVHSADHTDMFMICFPKPLQCRCCVLLNWTRLQDYIINVSLTTVSYDIWPCVWINTENNKQQTKTN